jgi:RNA polymerase sigma-70 factor (ECF subfamily)
MTEQEWLAERFEGNRAHLKAVAYRMLGSSDEADDAVQEAWIRLSRANTSNVANLDGWLTTVVARVCLDMLRSRRSRREDSLDAQAPGSIASSEGETDPEKEAVLADSIGMAMLVVLDTLAPAERVAFVLHDMFDLPFDEIAPIIGRSSAATRQLASRARRRVQGAETPDAGPGRRREVINAFMAASRGGDLKSLLAVLDPDIVVRADHEAVRLGAKSEVRGAEAVIGTFVVRAGGARPALVNGVPALVWAPGGQPRVVFDFEVRAGRIVRIDLVADRDRLRGFDIEFLAP